MRSAGSSISGIAFSPGSIADRQPQLAFSAIGLDNVLTNPLHMALIAGLVLSPFVYQLFEPLPDLRIDASTATLVLAGLLVGIGTRYGSGCTSGHGVCGLSRRSPRSLTATVAFMAAGFATVFVIRHLAGS